MLKTVFTIGDANTGSDILLLELGDDYCCYALLRQKERTFQQIKYIGFDEWEGEENLVQVLDELKNENCEHAIVCSAFSQALLIPAQFSRGGHSFLDTICDAPLQKYFRDSIPEWQMITTYSMPVPIFTLIAERFSSVQYFHAYTPALKVYNGFTATDQIDINFGTQHFRIVARKEKQVQLAQTYFYKTHLDVVYYLLKICYEFHLEQTEVFLIVSGLIDIDSAMYNELHNYFLNLHFAQAPSYSLPENDYPQHYFSSLYNLAACVS